MKYQTFVQLLTIEILIGIRITILEFNILEKFSNRRYSSRILQGFSLEKHLALTNCIHVLVIQITLKWFLEGFLVLSSLK